MTTLCSKSSLIFRRKMAEIQPLLNNIHLQVQDDDEEQQMMVADKTITRTRIASLDVFRGLSIFLMVLVDYASSSFPIIAHVPWNGLHLADFVMPMFLFAAGVSLAIVYKKTENRFEATWKAIVRAAKLFLLGVFLQGQVLTRYSPVRHWKHHFPSDLHVLSMPPAFILSQDRTLHEIHRKGYNSAVECHLDVVEVISSSLIIPKPNRIAIGYIAAAVCEIWLPRQVWKKNTFLRNYIWHWFAVIFLCAIYIGLTYGLYVADWHFNDSYSLSSLISENGTTIHTVTCSVRGDLGPACNAAGMIDRYVLGMDHLYQKPVYRNLKECEISKGSQVSESSPSWCYAPFEPEGILSSLTASVACIIGLQYGHILTELQGHKNRLCNWFLMSVLFLVTGSILALIGIPLNKSLYTISYLLVTSAASGITFCALYLLVDVYGWRHVAFAFEWMGKHSLSIFVLVTSNLIVIALQGFYWKSPHNNV
nr:heparan-alpha-glucosaminide N-acetyltransferase-like isoform X1 [Tanacetum cinerariifolium]